MILLYKHSPVCGVSAAALREVRAFAESTPAVPVWRVDVIRQRDLSKRIAAELGIGHASPQVILLAQEQPVYSESHFHISRAAIAEAVVRTTTRDDGKVGAPDGPRPACVPHP